MKKTLIPLLFFLFISLSIISGCKSRVNDPVSTIDNNASSTPKGEPMSTIPPDFDYVSPEIFTRANEILNGMTTKEMVGQLFMICPDALGNQTTLDDTAAQKLDDYPVGGFCLFAQNIQDPVQLQTLMNDINARCQIKPIYSIDEEGGKVTRIAKNSNFSVQTFPTMEEIALSGNTNTAYQLGNTIGTYLHEYGFTLNFAPVADVNTNPNNPVIGVRAFGSNPTIAADMVENAINGFHSANIGCTLKHFPGHGDTSTDTHTGSAIITKTWDEMKNCELIPFIRGIEAGADAVMIAHINATNVTSEDLPCSLSYEAITEKLRQELGFKGLVVTDALNMKAITDNFTPAEAAVTAFLAGADILLLPSDIEAAFDGVLEAVQNGTIETTRLQESVLRILSFKLQYGVIS